jgi:hypothetical protein
MRVLKDIGIGLLFLLTSAVMAVCFLGFIGFFDKV